jgi:hypothetical protein
MNNLVRSSESEPIKVKDNPESTKHPLKKVSSFPNPSTANLPTPQPQRPNFFRFLSSSSFHYGSKTTSSSTSSINSLPDVIETNRIVRSYDSQRGGKLINQYLLVREIGRGFYGKVKLAIDTETNQPWVSDASNFKILFYNFSS